MKISYPSHVRWFREVASDPLQYLGGSNGKKIQSSITQMDDMGVYWLLAPLTDVFFEKFTPLYEKIIGEKQNGVSHDVYNKTLGKDFIEFPYYGLSLFDSGTYVGGTIFSVREDRVAYAFRAYERNWPKAKLKAGPALIAEFAVAEFAAQRKLKYISHGRDRNPYGLNSAIGLAIFKLSVGCKPLVTEDCTLETLETSELTVDTLVLITPPAGEDFINQALLVTTKANESLYEQVTKYPEQLQVEVIFRK